VQHFAVADKEDKKRRANQSTVSRDNERSESAPFRAWLRGDLTIATYHLPFQNFISVTSSSASSSAATLSCLGVRVTRYGFGLRDDSPLYPSRDMGSSGTGRISNAQSNREMARHSSLSTTWMAGQIRRLRCIRTKKVREKTPPMAGRMQGNPLYAPRAEGPMVPVHCVGEVARFSASKCVA
jgi:hypothetical protein